MTAVRVVVTVRCTLRRRQGRGRGGSRRRELAERFGEAASHPVRFALHLLLPTLLLLLLLLLLIRFIHDISRIIDPTMGTLHQKKVVIHDVYMNTNIKGEKQTGASLA